MDVIYAYSVDDALRQGVALLKHLGTREPSRNGAVIVAPNPVTTVYPSPKNRVSMWPLRDANPFFHLMEALWMLDGRNDVALPARYAANMVNFSDDGSTLYGAYGYRWREFFGYDQLAVLISDLSANNATRRAVLSMWDGNSDIAMSKDGKDVPCNTHAYFRIHDEKLDLTVCCRSNDIVWGAYGANVVHFSILLEYVAEQLGVGVGKYYQISNNYHAYIERPDTQRLFAPTATLPILTYGSFFPLGSTSPRFLEEVHDFLETQPGIYGTYENTFLGAVATPMKRAFDAYKYEDLKRAMDILEGSPIDWHVAGYAWLKRRAEKRATTQETR